MTPVAFRPSRAKEVVGVDKRTLYRWVKEGAIRLYKKNGCTFFVTQEILDYITSDGG